MQNGIFDSILHTSSPQPNDKQDGGQSVRHIAFDMFAWGLGQSDLWLVHGLVLTCMLGLISIQFSLFKATTYSASIRTRGIYLSVFLVLMFMLMSTQFSLAYTCACAYAYAYEFWVLFFKRELECLEWHILASTVIMPSNREAKSLRHVAMVAKFLGDSKPTKTLQKWNCTVSNFIYLIQFHLICQKLAKFSGVESERTVSTIHVCLEKGKENFVLSFTYSIKQACKLGSFMYKKAWFTCKIVDLLMYTSCLFAVLIAMAIIVA